MSADTPPAPSLTSEEDYRLDLPRLLIVFSVMLAVMLEIIDTSIVNVAVPVMMGNLGATLDEIDWVITSYIVANVIIIPLTGWMAGRFGRKRYFTTSILIFTAASAMCGASNTVEALIFWRIVQGLGGGALVATSQAILVETFPPSKQGVGQALFGVGAMVGPSLGPTLGGFLTDNYSWHWCFLINVPLGILAATLCGAYLHDPPHLAATHRRRVDWPGIALLVIGVGAFQTLLERGNKDDWFDSPLIVALAVLSAAGIIGLVVRELTTEDPVIDFRVLRHKQLALGCVLASLLGVGLFGLVFLFPVYTQSLLGWTAWQSGLAVLPSSMATALMMLMMGWLVWHVGPRPIFVTGMLLMPVTLWSMSQWTLASGWDDVMVPQLLRGITMGLLFIPLSTVALRSLPSAEVAKGAGMYNLFRQLGGSFGIAALAGILDRQTEVHRSALARHVGPFDPPTVQALDSLSQRLADGGLDLVQAEFVARALLDRMLEAQASMEAFYDAYFFIGVLFLSALPLAFMVSRHAPGKYAPIE
ncbi:MAG: DHA2 family efflux MFS transporter permease subunit [Deltaproteobacteria bacterium]|nr:DHA2 family efflux MFS transporter permease subunit [Deltaproteobacteria bacterium]MBW2359278.1 DHA2 family efflux MFS transporter permease subunit [Deltaproteobacteria bacterium]